MLTFVKFLLVLLYNLIYTDRKRVSPIWECGRGPHFVLNVKFPLMMCLWRIVLQLGNLSFAARL